jgi:hypothetical protein
MTPEMSARLLSAITRVFPVARSCATRAALSRPRLSIQKSVLPSAEMLFEAVVMESSAGTVENGSTLPSLKRNTSWPPPAFSLNARRSFRSSSASNAPYWSFW